MLSLRVLTATAVILISSYSAQSIDGAHTNVSSAQPNGCVYNNIPIPSLDFLTGSPGIEKSIYAVCDQGKLKCFEDDGFNDGLHGTKPLEECPKLRSTEHLFIRRLEEQDLDKLCTHKGTRVLGMTYLSGGPGRPGSVYAVCDENSSPPSLKCFQDDGRVDIRVPDKVVPCKDAPGVPKTEDNTLPTTTEAPDRRRLDAYRVGETLWPLGIVCYKYDFPAQSAFLAWFKASNQQMPANYKAMWEGVTQRKIEAAFRDYNPTGIQFMSIDQCKTSRYAAQACGGCKHYVNVEFELDWKKPEAGCWSYVGFIHNPQKPAPQSLNLSPGCWDHNTIVHEFGHAVGLHHDHQRKDRKVMILREAALASGVGLDQYATFKFKIGGTYDLNSVMHYDGDMMCLPSARYRNKRFCDVFQSRWRNWCTVPNKTKHCDPSQAVQDTIGRAKTLSPRDIASLKALYATEVARR